MYGSDASAAEEDVSAKTASFQNKRTSSFAYGVGPFETEEALRASFVYTRPATEWLPWRRPRWRRSVTRLWRRCSQPMESLFAVVPLSKTISTYRAGEDFVKDLVAKEVHVSFVFL